MYSPPVDSSTAMPGMTSVPDSTQAPAGATDAAPKKSMVVIVMPAYNAARTLERTYADIPHDIVDKIILVDDVSKDETVDVAKQLGLDVIIHQQNLGYGGNQLRE